MFRSLSTAASGMEAQQTRLDVTANNIANVATPGFKRSTPDFEELMVQVTRTPSASTEEASGSPTGLQVGMGVRVAGTERSHAQGDMRNTGNALDLAIEGQGFFPVRLGSGEIAYTRNGNFRVDAESRLVTSEGLPLASDITFPGETQNITISANGLVSATVAGSSAPVEVGRIEIANFVNPAGLMAAGHNLFKETTASGVAVTGAPGENGTGALAQGMLEQSNVKVVEEMIDLIAGQRAYEVNARVIRAADEMLQQASNLR